MACPEVKVGEFVKVTGAVGIVGLGYGAIRSVYLDIRVWCEKDDAFSSLDPVT